MRWTPLGMTLLLSAACFHASGGPAAEARTDDEPVEEVLRRLEDVSKAFVATARKVGPSVVHITAIRGRRGLFSGPSAGSLSVRFLSWASSSWVWSAAAFWKGLWERRGRSRRL